ncbi:tetratricopeptide repeat protein, partial [Kitasatospora setae]
ARHLFRLLGHAPAAGLTAETAATLAATTPAETATQLARLADAHLLHERPPGHYRLPGLLHPYAAGLPDETGRPLDVNQLPDAKRASDLDRDPEHNQLIDLTRTTDRKVLPLLTPSLSRTPSLPRTPARQPQPGPYPDDITVLGLICWKLGRLPEAADHFAHAARLLGAPSRDDGPGGAADREDRDREDRDREDADREAIARTNLAVVQRALGRPAEAIRLLGETLPVHRRHHNRFSAAVALTCLSAAHTDLGDHATGQLLAHSALTAARAVRHRALQANAQLALAESHFTARRTAEAAAAHREALALAEASGDRHPQAAALAGLAAALLDTDPRAALRTAERALALARAAEFRVLEGEALTVLTRVRARLGDPHTALSLGRDALARQRETGHRPGEARAHLALAQAAAALGSDAEAVRHRREALLITRAAAGSIPPN